MDMNTISLKRIKLLLQVDWYELKGFYLWGFLAISGLMLAVMLYSDDFSLTINHLTIILALLLLITFILGMTYIGFRSNSTKGLGFLTPARPVEKFITQFIILLILLLSSIIVYFLTTGVFSIIIGGNKSDVILDAFRVIFSEDTISLVLLFLLMIFWLGCLSFKEKGVLKSMLLVAVIMYLSLKSDQFFISYLIGQNGVNYEDWMCSSYIENLYPGILGIVQYKYYLFAAFALTIFYVGYLKLKEKEQR